LGSEQFRLDGHTLGVVDLSFNNIGNVLAISSLDSTVRSWNIDEGKKISEIKGDHSKILSQNFDLKVEIYKICFKDDR